MEKLIEKVEKLVKEGELSPITIGKEVLEQLGYEVKEMGFGYNSLALEIKKNGELVHREIVGE